MANVLFLFSFTLVFCSSQVRVQDREALYGLSHAIKALVKNL